MEEVNAPLVRHNINVIGVVGGGGFILIYKFNEDNVYGGRIKPPPPLVTQHFTIVRVVWGGCNSHPSKYYHIV